MKNLKNILTVPVLSIIIICLPGQVPSGLAQDSGNAGFDVRIDWAENITPGFSGPERLASQGGINLADDEIVTVKLYAGSYLRVEAVMELIGVGRYPVKNGLWQADFIRPSSPFQPDYYELTVLGKSVKQEYYLPLFAPHRFNERPKHIQVLHNILSELNGLQKELAEKINNLENIQQEPPESERIKKALGLYKTREELLKEAIRQWSDWEKEWLNRLVGLINRIEAEDIFLATREALRQPVGQLRLIYSQYRYYLFNDEKQLPADIPKPASLTWRFRYPDLSGLPGELEKELLYKITRELTAQKAELIKLYQSPGMAGRQNKLAGQEADLVKLKDELQIYRKSEMFSRGRVKNGEDDYQRLLNLLDLFSVLIKSIDSGLAQPADEKIKYEIIRLNDLIGQKTEKILADLQ